MPLENDARRNGMKRPALARLLLWGAGLLVGGFLVSLPLVVPRMPRHDWSAVPRWTLQGDGYVYPDDHPAPALADSAGIPAVDLGAPRGRVYNPLLVAQEAIRLSGKLHDPRSRDAFWRQVRWLRAHATRDPRLGVRWEHGYDWPPNGLRAPWISAMTQATAMAVMARAWNASGDSAYLRLAHGALRSFELDERAGGVVKRIAPGVAVYQDFPGERYVVLDGWVSAVAGVTEYARVSGDTAALRVAEEGRRSLAALLPCFHGRFGVYYSSRRDLTSPGYFEHAWNSLRYLARYAPELRPTVATWERARRGGFWAKYARVLYQAINWRLMPLRRSLDPAPPARRSG